MPHLPPQIAALILALAAGLAAAAPTRTFTLWPDRPGPPPPTTPELLALGGRVFRGACVQCHGEKGDGQGKEAKNLGVPPRDFTTGTFLIRSTPLGSLPLDADLFGSIRRGFRPDVGMPAFTFLSDNEVWAVIAYLKTFSERWKTEQPKPAIEIPPAPKRTPELEQLGRTVFVSMGACFVCHGMQGRGDGPAGAGTAYTVGSHKGEKVKPANFTRLKDLKGGSRPEDLFRSISTGLDGTPMPGFAHLTAEQRWGVAYFILSLNE